MLDAMFRGLLGGLCVAGYVLEAALIALIVIGLSWVFLWWADHWGAWMDMHPEREKKGGGPK